MRTRNEIWEIYTEGNMDDLSSIERVELCDILIEKKEKK